MAAEGAGLGGLHGNSSSAQRVAVCQASPQRLAQWFSGLSEPGRKMAQKASREALGGGTGWPGREAELGQEHCGEDVTQRMEILDG